MPRVTQDGNRLVWQYEHETVWIEPWGPNVLRVRATMLKDMSDEPGALVDAKPAEAKIVGGEKTATVRNGNLEARINEEGEIGFFRADTGAELARELGHGWRQPSRWWRAVGGGLFRVENTFAGYDGERLWGLGQHRNNRLDQKGCVVDLMQTNAEVAIPFFVSNRQYGFLWNNPGLGRVELRPEVTRWVAEGTRQVDYLVFGGPTYADIASQYADATGHAPVLPEWAAGFWQCKLRYLTQEELLSAAREHKRRGLPMSVIVVDYFHWTKQGEWKFDPADWPDPAAMVRELESMGIRVMVSVWPTVNLDGEGYREMCDRGMLVRTVSGSHPQMQMVDTGSTTTIFVQYYDPSNPEARRFVWEKIRDGYYRHGIKIWWLDACEPAIGPIHHDNLLYHAGPGAEVACRYPMWNAQTLYEGMKSEGETDLISLSRSAWAGIQRYGAAVWSGDIQTTFDSLREQVKAGLNMALSGIPWWTTDIGGFWGGDPDAPDYRELMVRWFQYGTFCPLFRLHGYRVPRREGLRHTGGPNEVWSYGEEAYAILREYLFLRERLRPYIMEQMRRANKDGTPPMRPLFFDFPGDAKAETVDDQFMFGPDLLVAPVLAAKATSRKVYLPEGAQWTDAWTGKKHAGGATVTADAPLHRIPLFLRDDAKLPIKG